MDAVILKNIELSKKELEQGKQFLSLSIEDEMQEHFQCLLDDAQQIATPKAIYRELHVDSIDEDIVTIAGTAFQSKVMSSNLTNIGRVIGYVITCGTELDDWSVQYNNDPLDRFISDGVKQSILYAAVGQVFERIKQTFSFTKTATMNPGSLPDWPITEQGRLLPMIGDIKQELGVTLTQSDLLVPMQSVSGIMFPTEVDYVNCMLCTKKECPGRRAAFDAVMYREKLGHTQE